MKYSVIIPAYNAKATIRRCLDSIVISLPEDSELILVDDGSNDGTEVICKEYAMQYPGIKFFSKPNGGVSSARNLGLDKASGDYVLFVDADDAVVINYFDRLNDALADSPDMLLFAKKLMGDPRCCIKKQGNGKSFSETLRTTRVLSRCFRRQELNLITTKAFRRDIIEENRNRFDERLDIGEDKVFAFAFALHCSKIKKIPDSLYLLSIDRSDSLSRKKRDNLCESVILEHRIMSDLPEAAELTDKCRKLYREALCYSFYRSAYTVSAKVGNYDFTPVVRRGKVRKILEVYSRENYYKPNELSCKCIAAPVKGTNAFFVDKTVNCFLKRGER